MYMDLIKVAGIEFHNELAEQGMMLGPLLYLANLITLYQYINANNFPGGLLFCCLYPFFKINIGQVGNTIVL